MHISSIELFCSYILFQQEISGKQKLSLIFIAFFLVVQETFAMVLHTIVQVSQNRSA